ncbi:cytochrome c-type biogenesis protein CcmE homolog, mitochondrial [Amaranthus tricolor]|uniref:cytochrome c-type biogenesis protein CcmE homolog, mitochondrial n=1 Tax=Amaranthus tricolor TaxID=29722 RepID=UPI002583E1B2|nr:cytochrome c-type biogenesis protein CcmE homolog, mitochondrial [Amaranthus tricolor]
MAARSTTFRLLHRLFHRHPQNPPSFASPPFSLYSLASFSTAASRRQPKKVDIGARARQLQTRRLWTYALTFSGVAGFVILVLNNFQDQLVFYVTPSEALDKFHANPSKNKFRLGGLVLEGSVHQSPSSPDTEFVVTDLITDVLVRYQGSLPDLFREGHSVVVEGFVKPFTDEIKASTGSAKCKEVTAKARSGECYFSATEVLAKHDEKYMPGEVAAAIEKNKKKIDEEAEAKKTATV